MLGYRLSFDFRGSRFQSISLTHTFTSLHITRPAKSWLDTSYPKAPFSSSGAVTGLSYSAILQACACKYLVRFQISPHHDSSASRHSQQPTCRDNVIPSRASHYLDLHQFNVNRVSIVTYAPVSVSPNPMAFYSTVR